MTAQFSDQVFYRGTEYSIAGIDGKGLFDPGAIGLKPVGKCSACWRGFLCTYAIRERRLLLDTVAICLEGVAPPLFGVAPRPDHSKLAAFDYVYDRLQHSVAFTGGILLARDFIQALYVHMGFHNAWKYREVHELVLRDGEVVQETDLSAKVAKVRRLLCSQPLEPGPSASRSEVGKWVERCFDQGYRRGQFDAPIPEPRDRTDISPDEVTRLRIGGQILGTFSPSWSVTLTAGEGKTEAEFRAKEEGYEPRSEAHPENYLRKLVGRLLKTGFLEVPGYRLPGGMLDGTVVEVGLSLGDGTVIERQYYCADRSEDRQVRSVWNLATSFLAKNYPKAWVKRDQERRIEQDEAIKLKEAQRLAKLATDNAVCRDLATELAAGRLCCPHCGGPSATIRFRDKAPDAESYFVCSKCGRSFVSLNG